jgi:cobalt-zinc-cadmium efflux system membrane fusion protein
MRRRVATTSLLFAAMSFSCRGGDPPAGARAEASRADGAAGAAGPPIVRVDPSVIGTDRIVVAPVTRRPMSGDVRIPAEVIASEQAAADVGALVSGRLASIEAREGDTVKRGQVIAYVDSTEAARAVADVIRARARADAASRRLDRQRALEQDRATSPAAVDDARTELAVAEADSAAARTVLSSLGISEPPPPSPHGALAARVPLRSPIDGVLVSRMTSLGAPVSPDKTLFRIVAPDRMIAEARWTDAVIPPPPDGTAVRLSARGGETSASCAGRVRTTIGLVDETTRARRVRILPDGRCAMLVPGAYLDVTFASATLGRPGAAVLAVPKEAVVDVRGAPTIFVAGREKGSFSAHVVRTGRTTNDEVALEDGVSEGALVVVAGTVLLKGELLRAELESQ